MSASTTSQFLIGQTYRANSVNGPTTSAASGYVAHSGGGQPNATSLTQAVNHVTTVAASGDSVRLGFPATPGRWPVLLVNDTANQLQFFGQGTDTINNAAASVGVPVPGNTVMLLGSPVAGKWFGVSPLSTAGGSLTGSVQFPTTASTYIGATSTQTYTRIVASSNPTVYPGDNRTVAHFANLATPATSARVLLDGYGAHTVLSFRRATGTPENPSAVLSGDSFGAISAWGYGTTGYNEGPDSGATSVDFQATENWTDTAHGACIIFRTTGNGTTDREDRMKIDQNGRVSIGTDTTAGFFTVSRNPNSAITTALNPIAILIANDATANRIEMDSYASSNQLAFSRANGTGASPTAVSSGDLIGNVASFGFASPSGYVANSTASVGFSASENWTSTAQGTRIVFNTTNTGTASSTEKMRLNAGGKLSVGTTVSDTKLTVSANASASVNVAPANTNFHLVGADSAQNIAEIEAFGGLSQVALYRADGTFGSPTALANTDVIGSLAVFGYNGSAYGSNSSASIAFAASQAWTGSANGTRIVLSLTANGSTTSNEIARWENSGNLLIGTTTDSGSIINANGAVQGTSFKVSTNQVVGARQTGWTAMTGTPNTNTAYDTSTVTLAQLAGRVMSLQAALTTHGLIGT